MSGFFSEKYWRYRRRIEGPTIEWDRACASCGYNLRGLPAGRRCPECGGMATTTDVPPGARGRTPLVDVLITSIGPERDRWISGLQLATAALGMAMIAPLAYYFLDLGATGAGPLAGYLALGGVISVAWMIATVMILPRSLDRAWPRLGPVRVGAILTQPLWIVGYGLWGMAVLAASRGTPAPLLETAHVVVRGAAGIGAILAFIVLKQIAEDARLELQAERLNLAVWLLPIIAPLALVVRLAFPGTLAGLSFTPMGLLGLLFLVPPLLAVLAWTWAMSLVVRSVRDMRQHLVWAGRHALERQAREQRIAEKRRQMDDDLARTIRPLPRDE